MPKATVTHEGDGALVRIFGIKCSPTGGAEAVSHCGCTEVKRRVDREQVAADIGTDDMCADFAFR